MKRLIITLAILLMAGTAYADTATVLQGTEVSSWLVFENDGDIILTGPQGQSGFGQRTEGQTWIGVPGNLEEDSIYIVIQHDD